jgi:hypothetical protein
MASSVRPISPRFDGAFFAYDPRHVLPALGYSFIGRQQLTSR